MLLKFETQLNESLKGSHFSKKEREIITDMKDALNKNDVKRVNDYLKLNTATDEICIHKIIRNTNSFNTGLNFGFVDLIFDEYGWLKNEKWENRTSIEFNFKKAIINWNKIEIAKGQNDKWTYGLYFSTSTYAGGCFGLSKFDTPYESYEEALEKALDDLFDRHSGSETDISKFIRECVEDKRKELKKIDRNNQLLLF